MRRAADDGIFYNIGKRCYFGSMRARSLIPLLVSSILFAFVAASAQTPIPTMNKNRFALVVHGGAGTMNRAEMTPEREKAIRGGIENALRAGQEILERGGAALDAVQAAVRVFEDDPNFNAGKGAVFTSAGTNELDASLMDGRTLAAGAVAGVQHVRNPILLARAVMDKSKHVLLMGAGAEAFARANGFEMVDAKYFFTPQRWDALQKLKAKEKESGAAGKKSVVSDSDRHGTVGCAALDQNGNLAAATSTGGNTNKLPGRVGDSPIIGAGTYADNKTCAVSCTGDGEFFIRAAVAHEVSALMELGGLTLAEASAQALEKAKQLGGDGGLVAVGRDGSIAMPFNTSGMYRGYLAPDGKLLTAIYSEP